MCVCVCVCDKYTFIGKVASQTYYCFFFFFCLRVAFIKVFNGEMIIGITYNSMLSCRILLETQTNGKL